MNFQLDQFPPNLNHTLPLEHYSSENIKELDSFIRNRVALTFPKTIWCAVLDNFIFATGNVARIMLLDLCDVPLLICCDTEPTLSVVTWRLENGI
jgi:hypothetical protein